MAVKAEETFKQELQEPSSWLSDFAMLECVNSSPPVKPEKQSVKLESGKQLSQICPPEKSTFALECKLRRFVLFNFK
jgi:hypothetical protein